MRFIQTGSDVIKTKKKGYQIFMIYYQSWKFHGNRSNRFREIGCTKSVRKIIRIKIIIKAIGPIFWNQSNDIDIDRNSTLQASLEAHGPIFWNQLIDLNKLNNFCSICLYKMFTSKELSISTYIRLSRRALRTVGLYFEINR